MAENNTMITDKIFELLNKKGISQKKLSDMTGISTSAISDWKHKGTVPSAAKVQKICTALGVDPEQIFGNTSINKFDVLYIDKNDELYEFVSKFNKLDSERRKRILAYAMAILNTQV